MESYIYIIACPLVFCLLDVATGYAAAMRNGTLNSSVMREGLWNKTAEVLAILVSVLAQMGVYIYGDGFLNIQLDVPVITVICAYISIYELTSIVENIGKMNQNIGEKLISTFGIAPEKVGLIAVPIEENEEVKEDDEQS